MPRPVAEPVVEAVEYPGTPVQSAVASQHFERSHPSRKRASGPRWTAHALPPREAKLPRISAIGFLPEAVQSHASCRSLNAELFGDFQIVDPAGLS
jgi:hypothetical protein